MSEPERLLPTGDFASNFSDNPMVRRHGRGPEGETCRSCRHLAAKQFNARRYYKCEWRGDTNGQGTDHRLKWHACRLFEVAP